MRGWEAFRGTMGAMIRTGAWVALLLLFSCAAPSLARAAGQGGDAGGIERVRVDADGRGFVLEPSGRPFIPWGFNYSTSSRLVEDCWDDEWKTVADDFSEMKRLGANVVRLHIQFARFMDGPDKPNERSLRQLGRL